MPNLYRLTPGVDKPQLLLTLDILAAPMDRLAIDASKALQALEPGTRATLSPLEDRTHLPGYLVDQLVAALADRAKVEYMYINIPLKGRQVIREQGPRQALTEETEPSEPEDTSIKRVRCIRSVTIEILPLPTIVSHT